MEINPQESKPMHKMSLNGRINTWTGLKSCHNFLLLLELSRVNALFHFIYAQHLFKRIIVKQIEKKIYIYITLITPRQSAGKIDTATHNLQ